MSLSRLLRNLLAMVRSIGTSNTGGAKPVTPRGRGRNAPDSTPTAFSFTPISGADLSSVYVSNAVTVAGINITATVTVSGGEYSVNGGAYTDLDGQVAANDIIRLRLTSSASYDTTTTATLTIGGVAGTFSVRTKALVLDTTPDSFVFLPVANAVLSILYTSNTITVAGLSDGVSVAVSVSGGSYVKNGGTAATANTTAVNGDTFALKLTSSASYVTLAQARLTIGGVSGAYSVTTTVAPADTVPDAFSFTAVTDATRSTLYTSGAVTVAGINAATTVSVQGGEWNKNGGVYGSADGTCVLGDVLRVRLTSSGAYQTTASARLTIGGVSALYSVTTEDAPVAPPTDEILFGFKTRCGYGGYATNLAAGSAISGTGASDWTIDAYGNLVPSGTYGTAKTFSKSAGQSYSLTFADGTTRTVTLVANGAHVAATPADSASSFQLQKVLSIAIGQPGAMVKGTDEIVCRDGYLNPTAADWRISLPAGGYAGSGKIIIRAENPTAGNDTNGNPWRGGGFRVGALIFNATTDAEFPFTFEDVTGYRNANVNRHFFGYSSPTVGWGVGFTRCRAENDESLTSYTNYGFQVRRATAYQCHAKRVINGFDCVCDTTVQTRIAECVGEHLGSDFIHFVGENILVEDNFSFNYLIPPLAHADSVQHGGAKTKSLTSLGTFRRNIHVTNSSSSGPQGDFFGDTVTPYRVAGCTVENEIIITGAANAVSMTYYDGALVRNCTVLKPIGSAVVGATDATIRMVNCGTSEVDSCVANAYALGGMTSTDNVTIDAVDDVTLLALYQAAMPGYVGGTNPGYVTRAAVIAAVKPANLAVASGGFKKLDGTYAGALDNTGAYVT
jgi:hypothetical protein